MFKTRNEIIDILQNRINEGESIAKQLYDILISAPTIDGVLSKIIAFITSGIVNDDKIFGEIPSIKKFKEETDNPVLIRFRISLKQMEYNLILADLLSSYRDSEITMNFVKSIYCNYIQYYNKLFASENILGLDLPQASENLALLYSDRKCVLYNLKTALSYFLTRFEGISDPEKVNSDNPDVLYYYYLALKSSDESYERDNAFQILKKAANEGSKKAQQAFRNYCISRKLCVYCGGPFKGFFKKKCILCGKPKSYK